MVSHWAIGVPIILGTLIGTVVLAIPRQHAYSRPQQVLVSTTGKRRTKEELVQELLSRTAPCDDYEMKPVVNE